MRLAECGGWRLACALTEKNLKTQKKNKSMGKEVSWGIHNPRLLPQRRNCSKAQGCEIVARGEITL